MEKIAVKNVDTYTGNGSRGPTASLETLFAEADDRLRFTAPYELRGRIEDSKGEPIHQLVELDTHLARSVGFHAMLKTAESN